MVNLVLLGAWSNISIEATYFMMKLKQLRCFVSSPLRWNN